MGRNLFYQPVTIEAVASQRCVNSTQKELKRFVQGGLLVAESFLHRDDVAVHVFQVDHDLGIKHGGFKLVFSCGNGLDDRRLRRDQP